MDWTQAFTIIGAVGAFSLWIFTKLDADIKNIGDKLDAHIAASNQRTDAYITTSNERTDKLYQMFIDLLKEGQKKG
jgi:hypothetical protein